MSTIPRLFLDQVRAKASDVAIHIKRDGQFAPLTWEEVGLDVRRYVAHLIELGVGHGDRVVQFAENRYEWILTDLALHMVGAIHVPVHSTLSGLQVVEQAIDSGAEILIVSTQELAEKLVTSSIPLPESIRVYSFDVVTSSSLAAAQFDQGEVDLTAALDLEASVAERVLPEHLATILYTSGTTGEPKGVMLNQHNLVTNSVGANNKIEQQESDLRLNMLPLSHIFARTADLYSWIVGGSVLALAESRDTVIPDAQQIKPTVLNAVPYFYARIQKALAEKGVADAPGAVNNLLGGRVRFCCSGGAPLTTPLYDYFKSQELPLLQGYGLTESSPVITVSSLSEDRRGAVGKPIEDVEIKIAADGEVLTKGPHVMVGYWQNERATNEVIKDDWLLTGDLGEIDDDGYLYITGRKKELIVTATGKNVAPAYLEALLVEDPVIAQALVIGDNRKFLTALIVPDPQALQNVVGEEGLADLNGSQVQDAIGGRIAERLSQVAKNEQIGKFLVLSRPFSADRGELTAKLSLRRSVIHEHFAAEIESMYA